MKLTVFSDPHVDIHMKRGFPDFIERLNDYLEVLEPDIILVTGDVAGSTKYIQLFLEGITPPVKKKIFCPGNHDIWVNSKSHNASWVKYYHILSELSRELGWHYLPTQPLTINNVAFAGTMGWYDYSSRNPIWDTEISMQEYATKYNKKSGGVWMDREFARFGKYNDKIIADHLASELILDLQNLSEEIFQEKLSSKPLMLKEFDKYRKPSKPKFDKIDTIVIGTHIVPFSEFVKFTGNLDWDFFSAFIGNITLGEIIKGIKKEFRRISVFGHTHFPQRGILEYNLEAICCPIGYPNEWEKDHDSLESLFGSRIVSIDI